ncbi:protein asteroid homolog 1-like [Morone saxatilis]|uniref:protein asteroid homolog 1-like n=1 Tax=Morone saxatilis TaxID=34816 RepID=UPI0015E20944|nr:protein asteroid homolog 1-like [Morone saxatilis]
MGVQGLATLIKNHRTIYRDVRFRKSRLVIDGCNLIYLLYFNSGLDQNRGGEYAAFEDLIEKFIKALRDCGVTPYVVLDGGADLTGKKVETTTLRAKDKVKRAHRAAVGDMKQNILPQLAELTLLNWLARVQRAQPPPDESLLKALLLGISNGEALRQRAALQIQNEYCKQKLDVRVVHAFNQWQSCLKDSIHLNQLLGFPLPEPQIARLYEGTVVHHLVYWMRTGGKLKHFLKSDCSSVKQYQAMLAVVHQLPTQEVSTPSEIQKTATALQRQPLNDLTANLQQLYGDEDEEAATEVRSAVKALEDIHLDDLVSVRTRYKAKERNNRCKNL